MQRFLWVALALICSTLAGAASALSHGMGYVESIMGILREEPGGRLSKASP